MRLGRHIIAAGCVALCLSTASVVEAQTVDQLYKEGVQARLEQRFDAAADYLNRALALQPDNADAIIQLGFVELARNNLTAAQLSFTKVLALAPGYVDAKFGLAQVEFRKGNLDAALSYIEPLAKAQPENAEFAALQKNITDAKQAPATARRKAQQRKARTADAGKLMEVATRQRIAGQYADAERSYRKVLAIDPRNADALAGLAFIAGARKRYDAASRYFRAALAANPKHLDARLGLARLAVRQNDPVTARARLDRILRDEPNNREVLLLKGQIALIEGDDDQAQAAYERVLGATPNNVDALIGLGDVLRAKGDAQGARAAYNKALILDPQSTVIRDRLAAPFPTKWRLDTATEISDLSSGLGTWTDSSVGINYRPNQEIAIGARTRTVTRFGHTDIQLELRTDYTVDDRLSIYGVGAGAPEADILAEYLFGAGAGWQLIPKQGQFGPLTLNLDTRYEHFAESEIVTLSPWAQAFFFDERLGLSARWVHVEDDQNTTVDGYVLRGDVRLGDSVLVFGGYSDAPEISEGAIVDTETVFTGIAVDINDTLTLRGNYAYEAREVFDRDIYGLGLTVRF